MRSIARHGFIDLKDGGDVRMMQRSGRSGLSVKAFSIFLGGQSGRRKNLDSHRPVKLRVLGFVDDAHAAAAEFACDLVMG